MLLPWISETMGLIPVDINSNFLRDFPLAVKRVVVSSVVKYFATQFDLAVKTIKTPSHLDFNMEVIGQSFLLPVDDAEVINLAIDIYQKWLFNVDQRPDPMKKDPQTYIKRIFKHFSFLFEVRQGQTASLTKDHIYLSNRVLDIFLQMASRGDMMTEDTWLHILRIILGVTDATLRSNGLLELSYGLIKVLFEVWLCSLSYDREMWHNLQTYMYQWGKHMAAIKQWSSVCLALTLRVINLLYGVTEGTDVVRIQWQGLNPTYNPNPNVGNPTTELQLPDEYVYFAWNMCLHTIGNPNKLVEPEIHLRAFQGLKDMTEHLATIGTEPPIEKLKQEKSDFRLLYPPDTNSILEMYGPWLFEAVNRKQPAYNEGKAVAFASLCRIYCRKGASKPVIKQNLALFYHAIIEGLSEDDIIVVSSILLNSCKIFSYELEGSHILIPHYVRVCEKILCEGRDKNYPEMLRSAAIQLITSCICMPNHFAGDENSKKNMIYVDLKFKIQSILQKVLLVEKSPRNLQHIIWSICLLIFEEININKDIAKTYISLLLDIISKHIASPTAEYTTAVILTIFEFLSTASQLYAKLILSDSTVAVVVVDHMALQIPIVVNRLSANPALADVLVECFYTMCDWIMCGPDKIMSDKECLTHIISAIEIGLNVDKFAKRSGPDIDNIKLSAEFVLCHMLNHAGHFPPTHESAQLSAIKSEQDEVFDDESGELSKWVRYFIFDDMFIITVIDQPNEKDGPGSTLICRDITGKFAWDAKLIYNPLPEPHSQLEERGIYMNSTSAELSGHSEELETNPIFVQYANPAKIKDRKGIELFEQLIDEEENIEREITEFSGDYFDIDLSSKQPIHPLKYEKECKFQMSRLLLSHFGFFNPQLNSRFCQLQPNQKLLRSIRLLDAAPERDCHKIGVIYVAEGQDTQQDILCNFSGSALYEKFLDTVGWKVDLRKHLGFLGGLDSSGTSTGTHAPYYADYKTEIMFHVPSMMPTSKKEPQQIHKKRHVGNDHVNIIWSEHTRDYYKNTIVSHFNFIHIVIYPLQSGLYRVDVMVKEPNTPIFGPLVVGSTLVSEHMLGPMVRVTALNGNRNARKTSTGYQKPYVSRKQLITELAQRYKAKLESNKYYASLFLPKIETLPILDPSYGKQAK